MSERLPRDVLGVRKVTTPDEEFFSVVSAGFPMSFFDNKGGVKEPTLPHHTYFTTKIIPTLDKLIDEKNMGRMRVMT